VSAQPVVADIARLYPPFRSRVMGAVALANRESSGKFEEFAGWVVFETWRSRERQLELFRMKRTPLRTPKRHGKGLAADVVWRDRRGLPRWDGPDAMWQRLGHAARVFDLVWGGDWPSRDRVHIEAGEDLLRRFATEKWGP
jgi:hypothetical protein